MMAKDLVRTRRYISKFYAMKTQLQAVSLRLQTLRSNEQMAQAMKGATRVGPKFSLKQINLNCKRETIDGTSNMLLILIFFILTII